MTFTLELGLLCAATLLQVLTLFVLLRNTGGLNTVVGSILIAEKMAQTIEDLHTKVDALNPQGPVVNIDNAAMDAMVNEGIALADASTFKGFDKFRVAREYVEKRIHAIGGKVDTRDIALRIEAAVTTRRENARRAG